MRGKLAWLVFCAVQATMAQQSASFRVSEHVFNAGGHPKDGAVVQSGSYRVSFDVIGDGAVRGGLSGASFAVDAGWAFGYRPPGEVTGVVFTDPITLVWDPDPSVGSYQLYRAALDAPGGAGCLQPDLAGPTATDGTLPAAGGGFYYLVTAANRLREEGTRGNDSGGMERSGASCP